jgi:hypothetical protein
MNVRRFGQQLRSVRHQRRGHFSRQMRLAPTFIGERIKNPECRRTHLYSEPRDRSRFLRYQRKSAAQKICYSFFFSGLGL